MLQDASQREHPESGHETDYQGRRGACHRLWLLGGRSDGRSAPCHGDVRQYENRDARRHAAGVSLDEPARLPSGRGQVQGSRPIRGVAAGDEQPGKSGARGGMVGNGYEARRPRQCRAQSTPRSRAQGGTSDQAYLGRYRPGIWNRISLFSTSPSAVTGATPARASGIIPPAPDRTSRAGNWRPCSWPAATRFPSHGRNCLRPACA